MADRQIAASEILAAIADVRDAASLTRDPFDKGQRRACNRIIAAVKRLLDE